MSESLKNQHVLKEQLKKWLNKYGFRARDVISMEIYRLSNMKQFNARVKFQLNIIIFI